ncbi:sensor histidine kinase [Thalassotalea ganghwensis]
MFKLQISIKYLVLALVIFCALISLMLVINLLYFPGKSAREEHIVNSLDVLVAAYSDKYELEGLPNFKEIVSEASLESGHLLVSKSGEILSISENLKNVPLPLPIQTEIGQFSITSENKQVNEKYFFYKSKILSGENIIHVAQDVTEFEIQRIALEKMFLIFFSVLGAASLFCAFLGFRFIKNIASINEVAKSVIATGDVSARIKANSSTIEVTELVNSLNYMFEKIETLIHEIRVVSDNIAHDLRTPLTRIRHRIDSLDFESGGTREQLLLIEALKKESGNLLNIFNALLSITNIESGNRHNIRDGVNLDELINDVIEFYEPLSSQKHQSLTSYSESITIPADRDLLFQALANIVDNSIKYTQEGGEITISTFLEKDHVTLNVIDNGIGVDSDELQNLTKRFYRVEKSRNQPGNGLGLSLVSAVVTLHKGKIAFNTQNPGLKVSITLPV